jgi:hypothetical protein
MNGEELDKELDEWLDRATSEYGRAETRPGFEARVIENLNSRLQRRKWFFRWIPVAATSAAILLFSVYYFHMEFKDHETSPIASRRPVELKTGPDQTVRKESAGNSAVPAANTAYAGKQAKRLRSDKPSGRFLSSGLSDQERYLIAFARAASEQNIIGLSDNHSFEPFQMPDFKIPDFKITSFEFEHLHAPTPGNEEKL